MWQVVLGYIVPVAEVTTHIWTYTNIFQMTKEVALTWLDMALTNIDWLNTGSCISSKIVYAQNPCRVYFYKHCRPRWDATVLKSRTIHIDIICFCLFIWFDALHPLSTIFKSCWDDTITNTLLFNLWPWYQGHLKCFPVPSISSDLCTLLHPTV